MNEWSHSHLPNSHHIDWVLESLKQNSQLWQEASSGVLDIAMWEAWDSARAAAGASARDRVWDVARALGRYDPAAMAASGAVLALVAYDDCDQYLNMSYEKLLVYAALSEKSLILLLLPMVYVREKLNEHALG